MVFDNAPKLLGQLQAAVHVAIDTQNNKLLPAPSGEDIMDPDFTGDQASKFGQHRIPDLVAKSVVNAFEVIDVKEYQRHWMPVTPHALDLFPDSFVKRAPVENAGEFVRGSQRSQIFLEFLPAFDLR